MSQRTLGNAKPGPELGAHISNIYNNPILESEREDRNWTSLKRLKSVLARMKKDFQERGVITSRQSESSLATRITSVAVATVAPPR